MDADTVDQTRAALLGIRVTVSRYAEGTSLASRMIAAERLGVLVLTPAEWEAAKAGETESEEP